MMCILANPTTKRRIMIANIVSRTLRIMVIGLIFHQFLDASHNASRYAFFLERPEEYRSTSSPFHLEVSGFYTLISSAFGREGGNAGVPELWGKYDLLNVLGSLSAVDPQKALTLQNKLPRQNSQLPFIVDAKSKTIGMTLRTEWNTPLRDITVGAWLPIMYTTADSRYRLNQVEALKAAQGLPGFFRPDLIDEARRQLHDILGLDYNNWRKGGVGDLDLYVRWHRFREYILSMRSINIAFQGGLIVPTGVKQDLNRPASIPFMGDGHWGCYLDIVPECELKQDLRLGCIFSAIFQAKNTRRRRIPVNNEPAPFSALIGQLEIKPGTTLKISPYVVFEHLKENLHLHIRYTYLRHAYDRWQVISLESSNANSFLTSRESLPLQCAQERRSEWRAHQVTFQLSYTPVSLFSGHVQPKIYCLYDVPINGNSIAKQHTISCGIGMAF